MSKFEQIVKEHFAKKQEQEELAKRMVESGDVTIDRNGRYHAGNDGFTWTDGKVYAAGEFLPYEDSMGVQMRKLTVRVTPAFADVLKTYFGSALGTGKRWVKGGVELCNAYIMVTPTLYASLSKHLPSRHVELGEATEEELATKKCWKFSLRGVTYAFNQGGETAFDMYCEKNGLIWGKNICFNRKNDGEFHVPKKPTQVFYSPLAGKMVCYKVTGKDYLDVSAV